MADRSVVHDAAVHQYVPLPFDRWEDAGNGRARHDRVHERSIGEADLAPVHDVAGDHVQRGGQVLEPLVVDVAAYQASQRTGRHEVLARAKEAEQSGEGLDRKDATAPDAEPQVGELVDGLGLEWPRGEERSVYRADRRRDDHV